MKDLPSILDRLTPRPAQVYEEMSTRALPVKAGTQAPRYEQLIHELESPWSEGPLGRAAEVQEATALLGQHGALTVRGLIGGGKTRFGAGLVMAAKAGGRHGFVTSLRGVRWNAAPTVVEAFAAHLERIARFGERVGQAPIDALDREPCTVLVDDAVEIESFTADERRDMVDCLRAFGARPNVQLIVNVSETQRADALQKDLGFTPYVLPTLSPNDTWRMFQHIAERFGVVFESRAIASLAISSVTPEQMVQVVRLAAAIALGDGNASGLVDVAKTSAAIGFTQFDPFVDLYPHLTPDLVSALLLQPPYRPRNNHEAEHLERWVRYGLAVSVGSGAYSLALNLFSEVLGKALPKRAWRTALRLHEQDPAYARDFLADMLTKVMAQRAGPVF